MNILIVDDEARIAQAIKRSLDEVGHQCQICNSADQALELVYDLTFDLIILDILLPGLISGLDITKRLRQDNINTPILILTALDNLKDKLSGFSYGADDYLVKPFSIKELIARVGAISKRPKDQLGLVLRVGDLQFNTISNSVTRNNYPIKLSNRELKLLKYLMYKHDVVLSKNEIIAHVWNGDSTILPNTVEVYIGYLRKKIDHSFSDSPKLLHTIFGFGYMMSDKR